MTDVPPKSPPLPLRLKRGGEAFIVQHAGDFVTLLSTAPSPPGSTLEATHTRGAHSVEVRVKVRGCRRESLPDGRAGFLVEGRFVSLSRSDRETLFASQIDSSSGSEFET